MHILGNAVRIVGNACRQVYAMASRCPPSICANCRRKFRDDDRIRIEGDGVWRSGKLTNVGARYVHEGKCQGYATAPHTPY